MLKINKFYKKKLLYLFIFILILSGLRIIVLSKETKFDSLNIKNIDRIEKTVRNDKYSFLIVGNIKNSLLLFHQKNLEKLNTDDAKFIVSVGNAVIDGAAFKYNTLYKNLKKIQKPIVLGFGRAEKSDRGDEKFYRHFGPYYFSFHLQNSFFIFLDSTGKTPRYLQNQWLQNELKISQKYKNRFVFTQKSPVVFQQLSDIFDEGYCFKDEGYRKFLLNIFHKFKVTAVFSGAAPIFSHRIIDGVNYFNSGCAGGALLVKYPQSFYHYLKVSVGSKIEYRPVSISKIKNSFFHKLLNNIFYYLDSFFYLSFVNFVLILAVIYIVLNYIYRKLSKPVNYYRNFDKQRDKMISETITVAMFSNNYLPFIGGVPISIKRLAEGMRKSGHQVYIFAPKYRKSDYGNYREEKDLFRYKPLFYYKKRNFTIPVPNIFSVKMKKKFLSLKPNIVHLHHPYWMGNIGLKWAKKYKIPTVFTYHTRLEMYAHNLPAFHKLFAGKIPHELIKNFANQCDGIIAPTTTAKEYLRNLGVGKIIEVIPTGIDFSDYEFSKDKITFLLEKYHHDTEIILFSVSRLSKEKNLDFLLNGIKYIAENTSVSFKTLIAGNGPERDNIIDFIKQNNLENKVILLGAVPPAEIAKYFLLADLFVFASKSETQGMVLLEAMAGKTPVVAVRSGGIDDVIENGLNGFKTEDNVSLWAEKIISLMVNKDKRKELSQNAFDFSQNYSKEKIAGKVENLYLRLMEKR